MKPKYWVQCPLSVLEDFLWDCDLDYDSYEGSKEEVIHGVLCDHNGLNDSNIRIVNTAWDLMTEENFQLRCKNRLEKLKAEIKYIKSVIDSKP